MNSQSASPLSCRPHASKPPVAIFVRCCASYGSHLPSCLAEGDPLIQHGPAITAELVRDPIIVNALIGAVSMAACALSLVLTTMVLHGANKSEQHDAALSKLLVQELVADNTPLQSRPACRRSTCAWLIGLRRNGQ
jgi:hypothetical protein